MRIEVNGIPAPQGSKRHVGNGRLVESSRAVGPWREAVRAETQRAFFGQGDFRWFGGAVRIDVVFWLPRPRSSSPKNRAYPIVRPDLDKLARAVLDGLVAGGAMADDSQVVTLTAQKKYADTRPPGALIVVLEAKEV